MLLYVDLEDATGERVTLHDELSPTRALAQVEGLAGLPGVRESVRPRPSGHGSLNRTRRMSDRVIALQGEVWGSTHEAAFAELDAIGAALGDAVAADRLLRWKRGADGLELQQAVRLAGDVKAPVAGAAHFLKWQTQLRASDPRAYSQQAASVSSAPMGDTGGGPGMPLGFPVEFLPGNAGRAVYTNAGNTSTPPVFELHGYLLDPRVQLVDDGSEIVLSGEVAPGDFLELDVANRTVLLNGTANRSAMRDFAATRWFELPRGTGAVRLLAEDASADAFLRITYRHAYA